MQYVQFNVFYLGEMVCKLIHAFKYAERRQAEADRIREKYPDRIPVSKYNVTLIFHIGITNLLCILSNCLNHR